MAIGGDYIATGHYARIICLPNGRYTLQEAKGIEKDQTYPYIHSFSDTISDTPEASMACVYALPEMMRSKKGFLNKLFKRND